MVQFTKLRLSGFKSFVDHTELSIGNGLTGIIGPNGCGKSNLVEALRWAMGETSAKRMRGSEMDDVIFAGTSSRPARNTAEVTIALDNADRTAPAELNHSDDLEIVRQIERGTGSKYRVNGRVVRAKDVQLLFADAASGANSPSIVSQGRVTAVVNAKPTERRMILEEAAGVAGLHARRHEAELRLRAADNNLTRVEDILGTMDIQLNALKKQARQAARYRKLSDNIKRDQAILFHMKWEEGLHKLELAMNGFNEAEAQVREKMSIVSRETTAQTDKASELPELRKAEAEAAAALQRVVIERDRLDSEEERIRTAQREADERLLQIVSDIEHEKSQAGETGEAIARLHDEARSLNEARESEQEMQKTAREELAELQKQEQALDEELNTTTENLASAETRHATLSSQADELDKRVTALAERRDNLKTRYEELKADAPSSEAVTGAEAAMRKAEEDSAAARDAYAKAEEARATAEEEVARLRQIHQELEKTHAKLAAEAEALENLLQSSRDDSYPPAIDSVTVKRGFENALAVAFGDDLEVSLAEDAPVHWKALPALDNAPALPGGVASLADHVKAPDALKRRLSQIGLVDDFATGEKLAAQLKPGQCIVTRDGAAWRWDGLVVAAGAQGAAAVRLQQKNRLEELRGEITKAGKEAERAAAELEAALEARVQAAGDENDTRIALREAERAVSDAHRLHAELANKAAAAASRLETISAQATETENELEQAVEKRDEVKRSLTELPDHTRARELLAELRAGIAEKRSEVAEARNTLNRLEMESRNRMQRLESINAEITAWKSRSERAATRIGELNARADEARETLESLKNRPAEIEEERQKLLSHITEAEKLRNAAADKLAEVENVYNESQRKLRAIEEELATAREARAHAEATVQGLREKTTDMERHIVEEFACRPDMLLKSVGLELADTLPDEEELERRLERFTRERENMGPVNLRAEVEAEELGTEIDNINNERDDLIAAINKLRNGIGRLNREARERLVKAFEQVDAHFQELFVQLFGGGRAFLKMVDSDDPLEAGLEIYAQPPGKKMQQLSLFSGGEQTLTSIALVFAMFLTNPAPICVLDEIDAALDDSNVDRVCALLEHMSKNGSTRFLVITHHRMTMARMDRLYGVTMTERGVSRLVSVDLNEGQAFAAAE